MEYTTPTFEPPYRVLVLAAATEGWFAAAPDERSRLLELLRDLFERFGADKTVQLVGSFDDDLFATGQPLSLPYSIYALYDLEGLSALVRLTHEIRSTDLARVFRLEARIGRPLFLLDN